MTHLNPVAGFKKLIILFWFFWWLIAFWTDIVGVLAHNGWLIKTWAPDANYPFLVESLKMYPVPAWVPQWSFAGIILWSLLSTLAFGWAALALFKPDARWRRRADWAFIISLCYWLAFFLADQLVMKFDLEENHMVQGGFELLTYLSLYLLPEAQTQEKTEV
ncbi:hypothetical protein [Legionella erythra]|uniref:Transmembrane protein n=1 Tax=Legionella erythra TaxID=448 RepID=A0A0W0THB0_LEGER|nr:hypothetical protein [Legionella erythra]KTC94613.1 hypothetical protein Lery_2780 [Legionella erythra]